jgi:uncharacterized membrane protein
MIKSKPQTPNPKLFLSVLTLCCLLILGCQGHLHESIITGLQNRGVSPELAVFITSMLPIIELRGAIPLGINFYHLVWYKVVLLAIIGNLVPILPILFLLDKISKLLSHVPIFKKFFDWLFTRTRKRSKIIEEYEMIGLAIFVGIPLPGTGAWTGSVAAFLLGLKYVPSIIAIFCGVLLAAVIVTGLSLLKMWGLIIICAVIIILLLRAIYMSRKNKKINNGG